MAIIGIMLWIEIISHLGILIYMGLLQRRNNLTEPFFALVQTGYFNLYVLTGFLMAPVTIRNTLAFAVITIILWIFGYPFARWIYRQMFPTKK